MWRIMRRKGFLFHSFYRWWRFLLVDQLDNPFFFTFYIFIGRTDSKVSTDSKGYSDVISPRSYRRVASRISPFVCERTISVLFKTSNKWVFSFGSIP